jgi:two-component system, chemotaxis family, protein-glutamate methylesterase/glutaminase
LEALTLGADDYVSKASNAGSLDRSLTHLRGEMVPKIKQFFRVPAQSMASAKPSYAPAAPPALVAAPVPEGSKLQPNVLVIGVSTGGPTALGTILPALPANFPLPVLVVQHMPPLFTRLLAERLDATCQLTVEEASQGQEVEAGKILIAPGDFHMKVSSSAGGVRACLDPSPRQNSCRLAVDVLFASVAESYGGAVLAVILTGMGRDGLHGVEVLRTRGARILVQDQESSVVWGMPGAVANAGLADRVLSLSEIVPEILRITG